MKKKGLLILGIFVLVILLISLFIYRKTGPNQNYSYYDLISSKQTIKKSFKYKRMKEYDKLYDLYSDKLIDASKRELENIKEINLIEISLVKDEKIYNLGYTLDGINNIPKDDLLFYNVKHEIKYLDSSIEPIESGEMTYLYLLVKNKNNKWLISSVAPN